MGAMEVGAMKTKFREAAKKTTVALSGAFGLLTFAQRSTLFRCRRSVIVSSG
jgi:hypothetical protein